MKPERESAWELFTLLAAGVLILAACVGGVEILGWAAGWDR